MTLLMMTLLDVLNTALHWKTSDLLSAWEGLAGQNLWQFALADQCSALCMGRTGGPEPCTLHWRTSTVLTALETEDRS